MSAAALIERFERLRFQALWSLQVDHSELARVEAEVLSQLPEHPLVLAHRARLALPETELPHPPRGLAGVAAAYVKGDLSAARSLLTRHQGPRVQVIRGDLLLAETLWSKALEHYEAARAVYQNHPPLLARLARCHLAMDSLGPAKQVLLEALSINPLHGPSRTLLVEHAASTKSERIGLPLRAPVQLDGDRLLLQKGMSEPERSLWRAWFVALRAAEQPLPPKSAAHRALLEAWRGLDLPAGLTESLCQQLFSWSDQGLLPAYQWTSGLTPENAPAFRQWQLKHQESLREFWDSGLSK